MSRLRTVAALARTVAARITTAALDRLDAAVCRASNDLSGDNDDA